MLVSARKRCDSASHVYLYVNAQLVNFTTVSNEICSKKYPVLSFQWESYNYGRYIAGESYEEMQWEGCRLAGTALIVSDEWLGIMVSLYKFVPVGISGHSNYVIWLTNLHFKKSAQFCWSNST